MSKDCNRDKQESNNKNFSNLLNSIKIIKTYIFLEYENN